MHDRIYRVKGVNITPGPGERIAIASAQRAAKSNERSRQILDYYQRKGTERRAE